MRVFIERWYSGLGSEDVTVDIYYDEPRARFEACAGLIVLFESTELADVLRWCMTAQTSTPTITLVTRDVDTGVENSSVHAIEVSATFDEMIIEGPSVIER